MPLTVEERNRLTEFCKKPLMAILATVYRRGAPQAVPLWYDFDGEHFIVTSVKSRVKVANVLRDNRVTLCVVDTSYHSHGIIVRGTAEVIEARAQKATRRLAIRYLGEEEGSKRADDMAKQERVIVNITPERLL